MNLKNGISILKNGKDMKDIHTVAMRSEVFSSKIPDILNHSCPKEDLFKKTKIYFFENVVARDKKSKDTMYSYLARCCQREKDAGDDETENKDVSLWICR